MLLFVTFGNTLVTPAHATLKRGTLRRILKEASLNAEEFVKSL